MQRRRERGGSRAQLIIVTALVLATVFVALALVLNSGIYSENLSTRETSDSEAPTGYAQEAEAAVADAYGIANDAGESTAYEVRGEFDEILDSWNSARSREAAQIGVSAETDWNPHIGWRLEQNADRSFAPAGDPNNESWRVVNGTENVGTFEMNVTREALYDASADFDNTNDEAFHLRVDDGTDTWLLYVFQDSQNSSIVVYAGDPSTHSNLGDLRDSDDSCVADRSRSIVNLHNESVDGTNCTPLNFSDSVSGPVDIWYDNVHDSNGDEQINGTYALVVNGPTAAGPRTAGQPDNFNEPDGDAPTAQAVVYSVSYTTRYERTDLSFTSDGRYAVREETYAD